MWILMNDSFLSVVKDRDKKNSLLVRARVEGDIERVFPDAIVKTNVGSDYMYRAYLPKRRVSKAIRKSIENIDYDNFKDSVSAEDKARHDAYFDIWITLLALQRGDSSDFEHPLFSYKDQYETVLTGSE